MFSLISKKNQTTFPAINLKKMVVFPSEKVSLVLEGKKVNETISRTHNNDHLLVLIFQKDESDETRSPIGVIAKVAEHWNLTETITGIIVEGLRRIRIANEFLDDEVKMAQISELTAEETGEKEPSSQIEALSRSAFDQFLKIIQTEGLIPVSMIEDLKKEYLSPQKTSDLIAYSLKLDFPEKLELLETVNLKKRLEKLNAKLANELNIAQAEKKIQEDVEKELEETQKEYILRERLKAIEKELGIYEEQKGYEELEKKLNKAGLPVPSEKKVLEELNRLKRMPEGSAEVPYIRSYLEWIVELPWSKETETKVDLKKAQTVLDEDHFGLEKPKERILEYLAIQRLTGGKGRGTILCFVGPPGTGKTSVGQSIARSIGRNFVRISLGGIRDEAEIRGHRRTYVGALPGRIIQGMRNAGAKNPVFMMDEIDKIGADFRGDPSAALLEVLDPAQNNSFSDHYIELPFDLSEVIFITTANILDTIPPALLDRMETIEFPGYTDEEKFHIAKKFLLPRVLNTTGLNEKQLVFEGGAIRKIISQYTQEAGVRELERKLAEVARKQAVNVAQNGPQKPVFITEKNLDDFLGPEEFEKESREEEDEVGVATGLAWTPQGGEIIFIETNNVPGKGNLTLTGQLGEVMQESAKAALSYVRSRWQEYHFPENFYYQSDIHIHVPSGAISKDGPSAGTAIATSLISLLTKRKVKKEIALTGEVTLSGKVLPVGGIKEKVLAAHRAGIKTVILPQENEKNLVDVPDETRKAIDFKFVRHMDEVPQIALKK